MIKYLQWLFAKIIPEEPIPPPPSIRWVVIADNDLNRHNAYWKEKIGKKAEWGGLTGMGDGGCTVCSVRFPEEILFNPEVNVARLESYQTT